MVDSTFPSQMVSCFLRLCRWCLLLLVGPTVNADIGVLSFWIPELRTLLGAIESEGGVVETVVIGPRKFYTTKYKGHNLVLVNTGVGISNSVIATTLLLTHFPSVTRLIGSGVAGGVDPSLRVGDVVIPDRWALYQFQLFAKEVADGVYEPPFFELDILVGPECGGFDGIDTYLSGPQACDVAAGETSNFDFIFPKSVPTPDPFAEDETNRISEGNSRKFWFEVDPTMYDVATNMELPILSAEANGAVLDYTPEIVVGGPAMSGPTFLDNAEYREYLFDEFAARAIDMETAGAAHVASQYGIPFLFFRSLSDLAGADQDQNVIGIFFSVAAINAVATLSAFLDALPIDNESRALPSAVLTGRTNPGSSTKCTRHR